MNTPHASGQEIARCLVFLQQSLYEAMQNQYPFVDCDYLTDAPRHGNVSTHDSFWEFTRHGKGFRFEEIPGGRVIDILTYKPSEPEFFDALRLSEFAESIGVNDISFPGGLAHAGSEREIERRLHFMLELGVLIRHSSDKRLYRLAGQPFGV